MPLGDGSLVCAYAHVHTNPAQHALNLFCASPPLLFQLLPCLACCSCTPLEWKANFKHAWPRMHALPATTPLCRWLQWNLMLGKGSWQTARCSSSLLPSSRQCRHPRAMTQGLRMEAWRTCTAHWRGGCACVHEPTCLWACMNLWAVLTQRLNKRGHWIDAMWKLGWWELKMPLGSLPEVQGC